MGDPRGFLQVPAGHAPCRPVEERVHDYLHVYDSMPAPEVRAQASRCMNCGVPFCHPACPLGNLIPDWNDLVYRDRWQAAILRLHLTNNFPEFTGMLCPAPCEAACVLNLNDDAVSIKEIELSIVNRAFDEGWIVPRPPQWRTGKRVAVVGSGPAGLAAAQQTNRAGHTVVVFEKDDRLGGLLRYGIPDYKLEKWTIDRRLDLLRAEGIEFAPNSHVGHNPSLADLRRDFDAALLTVGALRGHDLPIPGRDLTGIHPAMDYLVAQNRRVAGLAVDEAIDITAASKRVVVLGGGDTSADCLGNAHREGATSVEVLTHGPRPPHLPDPLTWPEWPFLLRTYPAHEEGGRRDWNVAVTGFSGEHGRVSGVHIQRVIRTPGSTIVRLPGTDAVLPADLVLLATGFTGPARDRLLDELNPRYDTNGALHTDGDFHTSVDGVWSAGDARRGASLIVWAIAEGRKAARAIDMSLMGRSRLPG